MPKSKSPVGRFTFWFQHDPGPRLDVFSEFWTTSVLRRCIFFQFGAQPGNQRVAKLGMPCGVPKRSLIQLSVHSVF